LGGRDLERKKGSQPFPVFLKCLTALERCVTVPGKMNENSFIIEINSVLSQ
jgi:hypothetical protein